MTEYTAQLGDSTDTARLGGKGANLSALIAEGFPVPDGFVVTTDAYRDFIDTAGLSDADPDRLRAAIPSHRMPDRMADAILTGYADLGSPAVAVRSSGTAEDLANVSFAGQHDTYLNIVGADAVLDAVRDCWASLWTPRAVAYRERLSWDERGIALAVVVQRMVDAEWAGVMFTVDPVSGRRDRIVIEAVRGLGEALVSGEVTGQHVEIDKATGAVVSGSTATDEPSLPLSTIDQLVALGRVAEERFGSPQDIEWTYADGSSALVQARPLTALPDAPVSATALPSPGSTSTRSGSKRTSSKKNSLGMFAVTADHMPYPPFPMDTSLVYRPALHAVLEGIRSLGLAAPPVYEVLVEIDDGVVQIVPPRVRPTWRALWRIPAATPKLVRLARTKTDAWRARSDETLLPLATRLDNADLSGMDEVQLLESSRNLILTLGRLMPSRFGAVVPGMASEQLLPLLLRATVGRDRAGDLAAGLMSDVPCVLTDENADLERIAAIVRSSAELRDVYLDVDPADIPELLGRSEQGRALLAEVDSHLRAYGFRSLSIFTVGLPPLRDTPWVVHGFIKSLARLDQAPARDARGRFDSASAELDSLPGIRARMLRPLIVRILASARNGAGFRDDSQYALETSLAVARRVLLELGRRLVDRGVLADQGDITYMEADEVEALLADDMSVEDAQRFTDRRRAARARSLDHYTVVPVELFESGSDEGRVQGMPASRGQVIGRVRVVHDETEFATLQQGEVLVCPFTNPTWTPLFSLAAAVVVDSGGAASHAAIVAREVGIPAVMGTMNGTRVLHDGQRVLVDADRGVVVPVGADELAGAVP